MYENRTHQILLNKMSWRTKKLLVLFASCLFRLSVANTLVRTEFTQSPVLLIISSGNSIVCNTKLVEQDCGYTECMYVRGWSNSYSPQKGNEIL